MTAAQLTKEEAGIGTATTLKDYFMVPNCFLANEDFDQAFSLTVKLNPNADVDFRVAFIDANAEGKVVGAQEGAEFVIFAIQVAEDMAPGNYEVNFPKTVVSGLGDGKGWGQIDPYTVSVTVKGDTPTAVTDINAKAVAGVKYYNLAGVESDQPFDGVNVVVTTYTDGTKAASKVIK